VSVTSTLPGDWQVVAAPLATQFLWSGVGMATAVGAATVAAMAAPATNSRVMWLSLIRMVAFLLSLELCCCISRIGSQECGVINADNHHCYLSADPGVPVGNQCGTCWREPPAMGSLRSTAGACPCDCLHQLPAPGVPKTKGCLETSCGPMMSAAGSK
jgi:hypothetical protein